MAVPDKICDNIVYDDRSFYFRAYNSSSGEGFGDAENFDFGFSPAVFRDGHIPVVDGEGQTPINAVVTSDIEVHYLCGVVDEDYSSIGFIGGGLGVRRRNNGLEHLLGAFHFILGHFQFSLSFEQSLV